MQPFVFVCVADTKTDVATFGDAALVPRKLLSDRGNIGDVANGGRDRGCANLVGHILVIQKDAIAIPVEVRLGGKLR